MEKNLSSFRRFIVSEKVKLSGLSFQQKMEYFWDYFKWHIIIVVVLVVSIIYTVVAITSQKEVILSGYFLDSIYIEEEEEPLFASFEDYAQIDTSTFTTEFFTNLSINQDDPTTSMIAMQRLVATITTGETDFIAAPIATFTEIAYQATPFFTDLRNLFSSEQLAQYSDLILWMDKQVQEGLDEAYELGVTTTIEYPDPRMPETMSEPIPIGLAFQNEELDMLYKTHNIIVCFGITENTSHSDMVLCFFQYLSSIN